jgi:ABC-type transporter Mla subunit MlaD
MSDSSQAGKVGLFVALGLLLAATLLLSFSKGFSFFRPTYELRLRVPSVAGLKNRSAVLMSGVPIGYVAGSIVASNGQGAIIRLKIDQRYGIHADARFTVEQIGFLGDQSIAIYPQQNIAPVLQPGDEVPGEEPFNIHEAARSTTGLVNDVEEMVKVLNRAILRADRTVFSESALTNLAVGLQNFRVISDRVLVMADRVTTLVETNSSSLSLSLSNMAQFSDGLNRLAAELRQMLATNRVEIAAAVKNLEESSRLVKGLATELDQGSGLAGAFIKDTALKGNVSVVASNLAVLSSNLNRYGLLYKPKAPKKESSVRELPYHGRNF